MWDNTEFSKASIHKIQNYAESGNGFACFQLARYFLFTNNYSDAIHYINMGINNGSNNCYALLGKIYERGIYLKQNYEKAISIYTTLAKEDNAFAKYALADMIYYGKGCTANAEKAYKIFLDLAINGYPKAQFRVGLLNQRGFGTPKDYEKALFWYKQAAEHRYQKAYTAIGTMYYLGQGVDVDLEQATKYYEIGAKNKDKIAYYMLGKCKLKGLGTKQNIKRGVKLLRKADKQGDKEAKSYLENVVGYNFSKEQEEQSIKDFFENELSF